MPALSCYAGRNGRQAGGGALFPPMKDAPQQAKLEDVGEEEIMGLIADGETIGTLGKRWGVSRRTFYNWINAGGKERREKLNEAKRLAAESLVDDADQKLASATVDNIVLVREQAKHLVWKAGKLDRDTWGEKPNAVNVNLDLGALHLDALRKLGKVEPRALPAPLEVLPAEVVTDE